MLENLKKYHIILASNSPRRKELLAGLGLTFEVRTIPNIDESYPDTLTGEEIPFYLSQKKAEAYRSQLSPVDLLITADTIVWIDGQVLGKPHNEEHACWMLKKLSGRLHHVITGVTLTNPVVGQYSFSVVSGVEFDVLSDEEIDYYISHYHPLDKAGAYGVQEWIGYIGVRRLIGSYYNVMGLPVQRLYQELKMRF